MKKRTYPCRVKPVRHELELLCVILVVSVPKSCSDETTKQNCSYRTVGVSQHMKSSGPWAYIDQQARSGLKPLAWRV